MNLKNIKNSKVILRVDFNVPINIEGEISDISRIEAAIPTILELFQNQNTITIISHLARPKNNDPKKSLFVVFQKLLEILTKKYNFDQSKIYFFKDIDSALDEVNKNSNNSPKIVFLENIRYYTEEEESDENFKNKLSYFGEFYVNEAFSCSHREHSSIMLHQKYDINHKFYGFLTQFEIHNINLFFKKNNELDLDKAEIKTAILGGSKISTKIKFINSFIDEFDYIFIGGAMANIILLLTHHNIGMSFVEEIKDDMKIFLENILFNEQYKSKLFFPIDAICTKNNEIGNNSMIFEKNIKDISDFDIIFDIGSNSRKIIKNLIDKSDKVVLNGPLGKFEDERFSEGTREIFEYASEKTKEGKIKSLIGGGDSISALKNFKLNMSDFTYASLSGGAFLEYIENNFNLCGLF